MSLEILVNVAPGETRVAQVENGTLQDFYLQRDGHRGVVGNIYRGRVHSVLPGMQAAFLDIGLARTAFLHASDIVREPRDHEMQTRPDIRHMLTENDRLLVQVLKDPLGSKGARLSTNISIPARHLVLMPYARQNAVSARIEDARERERLLTIVDRLADETDATGGFIVRTVGEGAGEAALAADMRFLNRLWQWVQQTASGTPPGHLVYGDLPLVTRMLRDLLAPEVERIRIDEPHACDEMTAFAQRFVPELAGRIEHYNRRAPIFDLYGVEDEIEAALQPVVPLKSGGSLVIQQTEAMTTVDVNTGAFVGTRNLEDTIVRTNLEATQAIARQLRLRNLGGIIIIDFIDMESADHRDQVLSALERALAADPAKNAIFQISPLGLVEMTRKRTRESLEHVLCETCPACGGRGTVKSLATVCQEIFREILRSGYRYATEQLLVLANPDVVAMLLDENADALAEVSETIERPVRLQAESLYQQEHFDIVVM